MATEVAVALAITDANTDETHVRVTVSETVHMRDPDDVPALVLESGAALQRMVADALEQAMRKVTVLHEQMQQRHG